MRIWFISPYNMPPELGHFNRHYNLAKYLKKIGHKPVVFVGSYLHNTEIQMIEDEQIIKKYENYDCEYYFIKICSYGKSKLKRIYAMYEFYKNVLKATKLFEKPDVILGSSPHPLACVAAIKLAGRYNCMSIGEVRDLWPESFVEYGILGKNNILLSFLYTGEQWIYRNSYKIIFTMEGGKDYILDKGWYIDQGGSIEKDKVNYLNNGVDLEQFYYNKEHYRLEDRDLNDDKAFKVIYTGSIGRINGIHKIVDAAVEIQKRDIKDVKFIIYGDGAYKSKLKKYCQEHYISNIVFKGKVNKKYIPYILSCSDLNIIHFEKNKLAKYGLSANKMFDYMASGKPIISDCLFGYDLIKKHKNGLVVNSDDGVGMADKIIKVKNMNKNEYKNLCYNSSVAAKEYDFLCLAQKLVNIIEGENHE